MRRHRRVSGAQHGGLQAGKAHVEAGAVQQRTRQRHARGVARRRLDLDRGPAGLAEAQDLRDLVERLAGRVVDGAAKAGEIVGPVHPQELAVAARYQQHEVWKRDPVGQPGRQRVPGKVVHAHQRQPGPGGDPLGQHHPRHDPADQPRPRRDRDPVKVGQRHARLCQRLFDAQVQTFGMGAGGDFRHHAAEIRMQRRLSRDDRRQDQGRAVARAHDGGGAVVATAFDAQKGQRHSCAVTGRGLRQAWVITGSARAPCPTPPPPSRSRATAPPSSSPARSRARTGSRPCCGGTGLRCWSRR